MSRRCNSIIDWNKFNPSGDYDVHALFRPYGRVSGTSRTLNNVAGNRLRGVSMASNTTAESSLLPPEEDAAPFVPEATEMGENGLASVDPGFASFLKKHSSPTHQRVTAGGRIVPMEKPGPPKFQIGQVGLRPSPMHGIRNEILPKSHFLDFSGGIRKPLDGVTHVPMIGKGHGASQALGLSAQTPLMQTAGFTTAPGMMLPGYPPTMLLSPQFQAQSQFGNSAWIPTDHAIHQPPSLFQAGQTFPPTPFTGLSSTINSRSGSVPNVASGEIVSPYTFTPATTPSSTLHMPVHQDPSKPAPPSVSPYQSMAFQNPFGPYPSTLHHNAPTCQPPSNGNGAINLFGDSTSGKNVSSEVLVIPPRSLEDAENLLKAKKLEMENFNREIAHFELQNRIIITAEDFPRHQEFVRQRRQDLQNEIAAAQRAKQHFQRLAEQGCVTVMNDLTTSENDVQPNNQDSFTSPQSRLNVRAASFKPADSVPTPPRDEHKSPSLALMKPVGKSTRNPLQPIQPRSSQYRGSWSSNAKHVATTSVHDHDDEGTLSPPTLEMGRLPPPAGGTALDGSNQMSTSGSDKTPTQLEELRDVRTQPAKKLSPYQEQFKYALEDRLAKREELRRLKFQPKYALRPKQADQTDEELVGAAKKQVEERRADAKAYRFDPDKLDHTKLQDRSVNVSRALFEQKSGGHILDPEHWSNLENQRHFEHYQDQCLDALRQDPGVRTLVKLWSSNRFQEVIGIGKREPRSDQEWEGLTDSERRYWIRRPDSVFVKRGATEPDRYQMENECEDCSKQSVASSGTMLSDELSESVSSAWAALISGVRSRYRNMESEKQRLAQAGWEDPAPATESKWDPAVRDTLRGSRDSRKRPSRRCLKHAEPKDPAWLDAWMEGLSVEQFLEKKREVEQAVAQAANLGRERDPLIYNDQEIGEKTSITVVQKLAVQGHLESVSGAVGALGKARDSQPNTPQGSPTRIQQFKRTYQGWHDRLIGKLKRDRETAAEEDAKIMPVEEAKASDRQAAYEAAVGINSRWDPDVWGNSDKYIHGKHGQLPAGVRIPMNTHIENEEPDQNAPKNQPQAPNPTTKWMDLISRH
ncbi:MAG: hypothetical protein Q9227_005257 [Pyrenula ochraceoflavens]